MVIRKAAMEDVDRLVEVRQDFQQMMKGTRGGPEFARAVRNYLKAGMADGSVVVWLAQEEGRIVSCAVLCCVEEMPVLANLSGRIGYIHNVFTLPEYRRQGLAEQLVRNCLQSAKEWGAGRVRLGATEQGRRLYEKLGFWQMQDEMQINTGAIF